MLEFFQFIVSLAAVVILLYAIGSFWPIFFLNVTQQINPRVINPKRPDVIGISEGQRFGSHLAFQQLTLNVKEKTPQVLMKLNTHASVVIVDIIAYGKNKKRLGVYRLQLQGNDLISYNLPQGTVEVIPVVQRLNQDVNTWNVYTMDQWRLWAYAAAQALSVTLLIQSTIHIFFYFYQIAPTNCPICRLEFYQTLMMSTWWIGLFVWLIIHTITIRVYATYHYAKVSA